MSESTEMYLESILVIQKRKGEVRSIDIAHELNFSKPTISQQIKRLKSLEYINVNEHNIISLTDKGMEIASMIYERHNELSRIFRYIGIPEDVATEDACRVEHYISPETFEALKNYFDPLIDKK